MRFVVIQKNKDGLIGLTITGSNPPVVKEINPESHASSSGISKGDSIRKVNGIDVGHQSFSKVIEIMKDCGPFLLLELFTKKLTNEFPSFQAKLSSQDTFLNRSMFNLNDNLKNLRTISMGNLNLDEKQEKIKKANKLNFFVTRTRGFSFTTANPAYLTVLLLYCQQESDYLFALLCYLIVEIFERKNAKNWQIGAYEIYSTFLDPTQSPLNIGIDQLEGVSDILKKFKSCRASKENLFSSLKTQLVPYLDEMCESYYQKCIVEKYNGYGSDSVHTCIKKLESDILVRKMLAEFYRRLEEFESTKDPVKAGLVKSVVNTVYINIGYNNVGVFAMPPGQILLKSSFEKKNKVPKKIKNHIFSELYCNYDKHCSMCKKLLYGPGPQGLLCSNCFCVVHFSCLNSSSVGICSKRTKIPAKRNSNFSVSFEKSVAFTLEKSKASAKSLNILPSEEYDDPDLGYPSHLPQISKNLYKDLDPKRLKLVEVTNEFIHTERTHLRNLKILCKVFREKMLEKKSFRLLVEIFFPNLIQVTQFHEKISNELKPFLDNLDESICPTLINYFTDEEFIFAVSWFCRDQKFIIERFRSVCRNDHRFMALVSEAENDPICRRLKFTDLIVTEMQRLTRYPLFIKQMQKYSEDEESLTAINDAYNAAMNILDLVNENVTLCENARRVEYISTRIEIKSGENDAFDFKNLSLSDKNLIYEGNLVWHVNKKSVEIIALLFEDILLLLQICEHRYALKTFTHKPPVGPKIFLTPLLKLDSIFIPRSNASSDKVFFIPVSIPEPHLYELEAPSTAKKTEWIEKLTTTIKSATYGSSGNLKKSRSNSKSLSSPQLSPSSSNAKCNHSEILNSDGNEN